MIWGLHAAMHQLCMTCCSSLHPFPPCQAAVPDILPPPPPNQPLSLFSCSILPRPFNECSLSYIGPVLKGGGSLTHALYKNRVKPRAKARAGFLEKARRDAAPAHLSHFRALRFPAPPPFSPPPPIKATLPPTMHGEEREGGKKNIASWVEGGIKPPPPWESI